MKDTINGWMLGSDMFDRHRYKNRKFNSSENSFKVHLCPNCNRVHENTYYNGEGGRIVFHEDFPTYRLKREICDLCK